MQILHPIDNFTYDLFFSSNELERNVEQLKQRMSAFYAVGPYKPNISVKDGFIEVIIDTDLIQGQQKAYQEVVMLGEKGKFEQAKQKLLPLIEKAPHISEYHRVLGQIYSELGEQEEAINSLIDSLKWDRKNGWALLMMGNIFARHHNDKDTALKYYEEAARANPDDHTTLTNIGAIMMQMGRGTEGIKYFQKAISVNPDYPNTYHALAMAEDSMGNLMRGFEHAIEALKKNRNRDTLYTQSLLLATSIAEKLIEEGKGRSIMKRYTRELEERTGIRIDTIEDETIDTAAKIEFAEIYNRDRHIIRYKPSSIAVEHLVMHELVHLDFVTNARKASKNQLFTSSRQNRSAFEKTLSSDIKRLRKQGVAEDSLDKYISAVFNGLNLQIYNAPIDLFIEDYLYLTHEELRPYQFISTLRLVKEGLFATTDARVISNAPKVVLSVSKIYTLVNAMHLRNLFGVDLIPDFKASHKELKQAEEFMREYEEYRHDKEPAEEYELVQNWANDLQLGDFFELVPESTHRKGKSPEDIIAAMEMNAMDVDEPDPYEEERMKTFLDQHKDKGLNMAVLMYMVDALKYLQKLSKNEVKAIAHEIAMKGMYGINPEKKDYKVPIMPDKTFTGYHLLAYYYVSWAIAEPHMLQSLQLPFDKEYAAAKQQLQLEG